MIDLFYILTRDIPSLQILSERNIGDIVIKFLDIKIHQYNVRKESLSHKSYIDRVLKISNALSCSIMFAPIIDKGDNVILHFHHHKYTPLFNIYYRDILADTAAIQLGPLESS